MNILPLITFLAAIVLLVLFEIVWSWINNRWHTPLEHEIAPLIYWSLIVVLLINCGIMIVRPGPPSDWAPFFIVAAIHVFICVCGGEFYRIRPDNTSSPNSSPNPPNSPVDDDTNEITKPGD